MAKINIRESLGRRDLSSDNKYDLRNTYDSLNLSESKKKQLAKALYENKSNRIIYSILNESSINTERKLEDIDFVMSYEMPAYFRVSDGGEPGCYIVSYDEYAEVKVKFDLTTPGYVFTIDGKGPFEHSSSEYIPSDISRELDSKIASNYNDLDEALGKRQLRENAYIKQFSRYSREYEKLDRLATFLTAMSPNKYYYYVEDTYFDFGQDWWWTTVIAKRNKNGRWDEGYQALSPRAQEAAILSQSDEELESLARQILASDFCPDKKSVSEDMSSETSYGHIDKTYWKHLSDESLLSWWARASKGAGPEAKFDDEIFDELRARGLVDDSGFINNPLSEAVTEAFDADRVKKRIACTTEFDNGRVFHDYFRASSAEAEEMARQKSIENPGKVFYVKYDNIMEPCSDIKWKNGKKINESRLVNEDIYAENFERHDWENLIDEQGFVSINNIRDYIWAAYDGDLDDKHYCAKSIVDDHKDDNFGKVGVEIIDQYAYDHNLEFAWDEEESTDSQLSETYDINDSAKMARVSELYRELESEGWEVLRDEYTGSKYYVIFRKLVAGKGQWKAIRYSHRDEPEIIDISYNQATGRESLDSFQSFRRKLGKDLLPNTSFNESKSVQEDIDAEDFDDIYDDEDDGVEEGNRFFAEGKDYTWSERIAGPIHLDFDNWAVWSATESVNILDYATEKPDGGYDVDKDAFMKAYMDAPVAYFVVDEDTGFIDWGPCDTDIEAKDFLNGKQDDWENEV